MEQVFAVKHKGITMKVKAADGDQMIKKVVSAFQGSPFPISELYCYSQWDDDIDAYTFVSPNDLFLSPSDGVRTIVIHDLTQTAPKIS